MKVRTEFQINGWPQWKTHPECDRVNVDPEDGWCSDCQSYHYTRRDGQWAPLTSIYTPEQWEHRYNGAGLRLNDLPIWEKYAILRERHLVRNPEDRKLYHFMLEFTHQVLGQRGLEPVHVDCCKHRQSLAYPWDPPEIWYGWEDLRSTFEYGFTEYVRVKPMLLTFINWLDDLRGLDVLRVTVLHEVAHILTYKQGHESDHHGSHFMESYADLLHEFAYGKTWTKPKKPKSARRRSPVE